MGAFKLDLMTILVLFVVLSVIFTMTSGARETKPASPSATVQKPLVQGMSDVKSVEFSNANYSNITPSIVNSKLAGRTWN